MPQQTIYLDAATEKRAKDAARSAGLPVSRWIADVIQQRTQTEWPPEIRGLAGAWRDFPTLAHVRKTGARRVGDAKREKL